ncbi:pyridoxamine 5'-phosphate oxidase family protein [Nocardioides sp. GY 10127]|uniref:pyridoxamine 5'-phosphate oxidase family protein n=1 Tax=Nocardioides sp. GY 10127 TaxID=2569762 RepID=UPI0010A8A9EC|nr:pyridoxamine 5'-phosphate oxidase family protein [Nocardioides sp. GY 10127]TIC85658.1 pyridoxamine 5'-phosphate oxidase family protein [Nocardioides sp. GY 10127]
MAARERALVELATDACWGLLQGSRVGLLAWTAPDGPTVRPVNLAVAGRTITFRTAAGSAMTQQVDDSLVALQVGATDGVERTGWSVLVRGTASVSFSSEEASPAEPWLRGARPVTVTVHAREVTGRVLVDDEGQIPHG